MKLNNNAFTIVELLGVIVILAMLSLISGVAITSVVKSSKKTLSDSQIETLKYSAQLWVENNLDKIDIPGCTYMAKEELEASGIISDIKEIDSIENITIKICSEIKQNVETPIITYEIITE